MKTLVVSLVLVFAFFLGCQDTINDPVSQDLNNNTAVQENVSYKTVIDTWPGYIRIHNYIYDPSHPQFENVLLNGLVRYKIDVKQSTENARYVNLKVNIYVDAEIRHRCPRQRTAPTVNSFTNETVKMLTNAEEPYFIEKIFIVRHTCCGPLQLILKFSVQQDRLTLISETLRPFGGWQTINYGE